MADDLSPDLVYAKLEGLDIEGEGRDWDMMIGNGSEVLPRGAVPCKGWPELDYYYIPHIPQGH